MFNLLVSSSGWAQSRDTMQIDRILEYTEKKLEDRYRPNGILDLDSLIRLPCLFLEESRRSGDQIVRVGNIIRAVASRRDVSLEYVYDLSIPSFTNEMLENIAIELGIDDFEFSRTHWAVKDANVFQALVRNLQPRRPQPRVFSISEPEFIEPSLVSAMMPFQSEYDSVYRQLKNTAESLGLRCRRADDIWENPEVIQDVVSLIDHSKIVICDCTGRNPNVFYEIGIAHTLGRETILITQSEDDIPFDLRHLRYVKYLNNGEGLRELNEILVRRLNQII